MGANNSLKKKIRELGVEMKPSKIKNKQKEKINYPQRRTKLSERNIKNKNKKYIAIKKKYNINNGSKKIEKFSSLGPSKSQKRRR